MQIGSLGQLEKKGQNSNTHKEIEIFKKSIIYLASITLSNFLW